MDRQQTAPLRWAREKLAGAVRSRVAGPEFASEHERIWQTPGTRWFSPADPIWRVHADTAMFIGGIRALLLQSLHPVAMQGVSEHSGFRSDPWGRLQRTSKFIATTTYGTIEDARASITRVRRIHDRVGGITPAGKPYRAGDPDLLLWIHVAEIDSFLRCYQAFGDAALTAAESDEYVRQTAQVAELLGVLEPPRNCAELAQMIERYRPILRYSEPAGEAIDLLLWKPAVEGALRAAYMPLAAGAVATLPAWARVGLRLPTLPLTDRLVARPMAQLATSAIRWALVAQAA